MNLEGFEIRAVETTSEGIEVLDSRWPEVLLLDVAMPGMDGIIFCRLIRDRYNLPILMLTARDTVEHRVTGLNAGADDYLGKPFDLNELVARIRALLRRSVAASSSAGVQQIGPISIDHSNWTVLVNGEPVDVTAREFYLLATLMSSPGRVFSRDELLQAAWGSEVDIQSNTLEVHIANLRRKLEANDTPRVIATIRRGGYAFRVA